MASKKGIIIGVDLGGTSIKAIAVDRKNTILATAKTKTPSSPSPKAVAAEIAGLVKKAANGAGYKLKQVSAVSVGAPGQVDGASGIVCEAANLGWKNVPLGAEVEALVGAPVVVENDVSAGTVGEHLLGAGEQAQEMVGVFVGTGIGGGIISRGKLFPGSRGWAGEVGHTVVQADGPVCSCGRRGHVEAFASRVAIERAVWEAIKSGQKSVIPQILKEREKERITSSIIQAALARNDRVMRSVMERAEFYLGILTANLMNILDPECVVIGGGIAERLGETFVGPIRKTAYEFSPRSHSARKLRIVAGALGDNAGALGGVMLARHRLRL
jgi:glucokinase